MEGNNSNQQNKRIRLSDVNFIDENDNTSFKKELFYDSSSSSTKFKFLDGKEIHFDKKLLYFFSNSPVIYQMTFGTLSKETIEIKDFGYETFKIFLDCLMGFTEITRENSIKIFPLATKYLITDFIEKCIPMLKPVEMNADVCHRLNMAFFYNQPALCAAIKEFVLADGSPYALLEKDEFSVLLSVESFLEVVKWVTVDSFVLKSIVRWCDNFLKMNNKSENIKELLDDLGLMDIFKAELFESAISLQEFVNSEYGKNILSHAEICNYFLRPDYSTTTKSKWITKLKGETFIEEFDLRNLQGDRFGNFGVKIGKIVTYASRNINISCIIKKNISNQPPNPGDILTGRWVRSMETFEFSLQSWRAYLNERIAVPLLKFYIEYNFLQDCRFLVKNKKPRGQTCPPHPSQSKYFTEKFIP